MTERSTGEINIDTFVATYEQDITRRIKKLGIRPGLTVLSDVPYSSSIPVNKLAPVSRYVRALEDGANTVGISLQIRAELAHAAFASAIEMANADPKTHGVVTTLPFSIANDKERLEFTQNVLNGISLKKDPDGLRSDGLPPATSAAAVAVVESVTNNDHDLLVHMRGKGHVGSGVVRLLKEGGYAVSSSDVHTSAAEELEMLEEADVVISATGAAEGLTPDHFGSSLNPANKAKKILVNIGRGRNKDGKMRGDFSPELLFAAEAHGWRYTNSSLGVGKVAILTVGDRTVTFAEMASAA